METEIKLALPDETAYLRLRDILGHPLRSIRQENRFLDGPDGELGLRRAVLRMRRELEPVPDAAASGVPARERHFLTLKAQGRVSGAVHTRGELEAEVAVRPAASWLDPGWLMTLDLLPVRALKQLVPGLVRLVDQGGFHNFREVFSPPAGSTISPGSLWELDRTEFAGGIVEYELEVELHLSGPDRRGDPHYVAEGRRGSQAEVELMELLRSWNVPFAAQPASKYQRWLSHRDADADVKRMSARGTEGDHHPGGNG